VVGQCVAVVVVLWRCRRLPCSMTRQSPSRRGSPPFFSNPSRSCAGCWSRWRRRDLRGCQTTGTAASLWLARRHGRDRHPEVAEPARQSRATLTGSGTLCIRSAFLVPLQDASKLFFFSP
jgi:hypothetical protein